MLVTLLPQHRLRALAACGHLGLLLAPHPALAEAPAPPAEAPTEQPAPEPAPRKEPESFRFGPGAGAPIVWPTTSRRFGWGDAVVSGTVLAAGVTAAIIGPREQGFYGGVLFDEAARDALRAPEFEGQLLARDLSDVLLALGISYAMIGDPLINASWLRNSPEVGGQLALLNLEVIALNTGLQQLVANSVGRERPYVRTCGTDELDERTFDCEGNDRNRSFYSGHASTTFAIAAATCTHHTYLRLSGDYPIFACLSGFTSATATALFRVVGDRHYLTDVMVGAAMGSLIGWGVPFFHHHTRTPPLSASVGEVSFTFVPYPGGLSVVGVMP